MAFPVIEGVVLFTFLHSCNIFPTCCGPLHKGVSAVPFFMLISSSSSAGSLSWYPPVVCLFHIIISSTCIHSLSMMSSTPIDCPFGAWESPITSQSITAGSIRLGNLQVIAGDDNGEDHVYWLEGRPQEGGRNVLCRYDPTNPNRSERNAVDVTPKESNVRTRVHEYGGGAVTFASGKVFFSEFVTQQVCRMAALQNNDSSSSSSDPPQPVTPDEKGCRYRFADGVYDEKRQMIFCIREDHGEGGTASPRDVLNEIVAVDMDGNMKVLVTGYDFCAAPRLSPDGKTLACIIWNHPNMPWDATKLLKLSLQDDIVFEGSSSPSRIETVVVAGQDGDTSILQPLFHPHTGDLYYLSDQTGYYNIFVDKHTEHPVLPMDADFGDAAPGWTLGQQGFSFLKDGRLVAQFKRDGSSVLVVAKVMEWSLGPLAVEGDEFDTKDGLPMQFGSVQGGATESTQEDLYFLGGNASTPTSIYKWNLEAKKPAEILACSSSLTFPEYIISVPEQIQFPTTLGTAFAYYYPPKNGNYQCTMEAAPPLLVKAHGGPTACTGTSFNPGIQFWTSRGFAILDVDYGGSTGYGRAYRRRLRKSWGIVDIDDVCNGAQYLVKQCLADGNRLCIDGGSAGGYTTLGALAFRDVFKAGCSLYGVGDLTALAGDTHKFESRYLDGLVGRYPEDERIYKERSPIESVDKLSCPILLLQGNEDKIVPPNQASTMHEALVKKGIPTCLKVYEGEQHGFRKAENIADALDSELSFYGKVFGIKVPNAIDLQIDNM